MLCVREGLATTPLGLRDALLRFPRVVEYGNPGLDYGSPSGKISSSTNTR